MGLGCCVVDGEVCCVVGCVGGVAPWGAGAPVPHVAPPLFEEEAALVFVPVVALVAAALLAAGAFGRCSAAKAGAFGFHGPQLTC